ncbi:hypothetical protein D6D29_01540 [Aureobasidium pullulans]|nr:hypothetical protein D6D29_01540 [Aureobasidium pullulans]THX88548.1 hypothetical protein D6D08_03970 [Aureobasidium pullulans]
MDYTQLTVAKLKDELKERDIPSTGLKLKKDFVDRLEQDDSDKVKDQPTASPAVPEHVHMPETDAIVTTVSDHSASTTISATATNDQLPLPTEDQSDVPDPQDHTQSAKPTGSARGSTPSVNAPSPADQVMDELPDAATPDPIKAEEPASADGKKRKRRSPSPIVSEHVVHKKLKQEADGPVVHLPSDQESLPNHEPMADGPPEEPHHTFQPISTSDDLTQPFTKDSDISRATRSPNERRFKNLINPAESDSVQSTTEPVDMSVSPAIHPATRALYIRDLVRPINPSGLRDHLEDIARPPDHLDGSASLVDECYVDALRTHAFILFTSISAASRARASTHARIWPPEPMRKQLWADFFPEERFQEFLDAERASGGSRPSQAKRWELAYNLVDDGVDVQLVEAGPAVHRASTHAGAPNAPPTGPRGSMSSGRRPSFAQTEQRRPSQPLVAPLPRRSSRVVEEASAPFLELDKLFNFTTTKPKLYWQPVSDNLADDRLDELDRETSRDWDPRADMKRNGDSLGRGLDQLKRYTFEDGDVLVDGGPEFGGGRAFARAGNRGRGRRNGDSYRRH